MTEKESKDVGEKARELARLLNEQPKVYTDENVFEYGDEDDEDWL